MKDTDATRGELLAELAELRRKVAQLERSELELQQVKNELRKSKQYLEAALHASLDAVCLVDSQGIVLALNDRTAERLGRKKDELLGKSLFDFLPSDLAKKRRETFETILETGQPLKAEREDFPGKFSRNSGYPIFGADGAVEAVIVFSQDVTDKKRAEEALSESEQRYRLVAENSLTGIFIYQDDKIVYVNKRAAEIVGCEPEEILEKSGWDFVHPEDVKMIENRSTTRSRSEDVSPQYELRVLTKDGKTKWLEVIAVQTQWQGRNTILGNVVDITERKEAEQRIKESEEKLRAIIEHSTNVFYSHTTDHVLTYVSPQVKDFLGIEPKEVLTKWTHFVTDNPVNLEGMRHTQLAIDTGQRQTPYELELIGQDGRKIWAEVHESPVVENGKTVAIVGSLTDITDRKRAEDALHESEERYRQLIDLCPDGIHVNVGGRFAFANNALAKILGMSGPDELIGKEILDFIHPKYHASIKERRRFVLEQGAAVPLIEEEWVRGDGTIVEVEVAAAPFVFNRQKAIVAVVRDISDRKRADRTLNQTRELLTNILRASPIGIAYAEEGKLKWANQAMFEMFGARHEEQWQDKELREYYASDEEYRRVQALFFQKFKQGAPAEGEARFKRIDGSVFHGYLRAVALDPSNPSKGSITTISDISARKRAEEALRESESMLRSILATSPVAIGLSHDRKMIWVNRAWAEVFGFDNENECIGLGAKILYPSDEEYKRVGVLYRNLRDGMLAETDTKMKRKDGSVFDAHIRMNDLDADDHTKGAIAAITNISQRKRMEEALRQSEATLKTVLEAAPIGIGLVSPDRVFVWANEFLSRMAGYTQEELKGQSTRILFESDEEFLRIGHAAYEEAKAQGTASTEMRTMRKDGAGIDTFLSFATVAPGDLSSGIIVTAMDIGERKRAEQIMLQSERLQAVADLASGVAHNFNNMLQIIVGSADLAVLDCELGDLPNVKKALTQILETSRFGAETVKRLQSFAHIRAEVQPAESHVFDLSEVAKQACEMSAPWWKTKPEKEGIKISLDLDLTSGCLIRGKKSELFEVLVNLIKNAAEAMPQGGQVTVKTALHGGQVVLTVWDTGIGISKEDLKKIFDPFWSSKGVKGTGMGLAITYGIISRHSGTISVESKEGAGSAFTIRLPYVKETPAARPRETKPFDFKLSILAIDDMVPIVLMLEQLLAKYGQTVFKAVSGRDGLEIFKEKDIDLVICDLGMPGMNGWDVGKAIRAICQERGVPKTPFVLLTGWGGQSLEEDKIEESGVDAVLEKPLDIPELLKVIGDAVNRSTNPSVEKS